jgi:hypothetical protein
MQGLAVSQQMPTVPQQQTSCSRINASNKMNETQRCIKNLSYGL